MPTNIYDKKGCGTRWPNTRRHAKYLGRHSHYAALHTVDLGTIVSWIRRGKEVGQLPPLTSRALMPRWKRRWYGTRYKPCYPKPYKEYAVIHDMSTRAIKRMVKRGKEVRFLPPLGDPEKLLRWRFRWMRRGRQQSRPAAKQLWLIKPLSSENPMCRRRNGG